MEYLQADGFTATVNIFSLFVSVITILIWVVILKDKAKDNELITVRLIYAETTPFALNGRIERKHFSRSEALGLVGMIPMDEDNERSRFEITYTIEPEFYDNLEKVQQTKGINTFDIKCTKEEILQFDQAALRKMSAM